MSKEFKGWVLYTASSNVPVVCERPDWKSCPEHRNLSEERPNVDSSNADVPEVDLTDDPDDDIVSVNEYGGKPKVSSSMFTEKFWNYLTATKGSSRLRDALASSEKTGERVLRGGLVASVVTAATGVGLAVAGVIGSAALLPIAGVVFALLPLSFIAKKIVRKAVFKSKANKVKQYFKDGFDSDGEIPEAKDGENLEYLIHRNKTLSDEDAEYYSVDTFYRQNG